MTNPFVAEIRIFAGNFAPLGWAFCNGQLLPINQNTALFSLIGTYYGGNGTTNFALPNLQGRAPLNAGQGPGLSFYDLGDNGGAQSVTLSTTQIPSHAHPALGSTAVGAQTTPGGAVPALPGISRGALAYKTGPPDTTLSPQALGVAGGNQPHNNMPPYLVVNFIIALQGVFPPRS
jgi:microcystin-dependent protein